MKCEGCGAELGSLCTVVKLHKTEKAEKAMPYPELVSPKAAETQGATAFCYPAGTECAYYVRFLLNQITERLGR